MTCNEVRMLTDEWVHGELDENRRRAIEEHLCSCAECSAVFRSEKSLSGLLGSSSPEPSVSVSSSVLSAIRKEKQKAARERMRVFTKYASVAAMLVLVIGIASALLYTGVFRRTGNLTDDPLSSSAPHTPDEEVSENVGSVERFLSGYPGTKAFVIDKETDIFDKLGITGFSSGKLAVYKVSAGLKDAFLALCGEESVVLSVYDGRLEPSEEVSSFLKDISLEDGDMIVFLNQQ